MVGLAALIAFASGLREEPHFVDESAIIAKSYFVDLVLPGGRDHPAWLSYGAYDHPPLGQYLTGLALRMTGEPFPNPRVFRDWQRNTATRGESNSALVAARWPSAILGAVGCVAIAAIGTLIGGPRVGVLAAVLLAINPLYALHARRAMADVPCQAFLLLTLALGLRNWKNILSDQGSTSSALVLAGASGVCGGLTALAKLNGLMAMVAVGGWLGLAVVLPGIARDRKLRLAGLTVVSALVAMGTFLVLNPTLTAKPGRGEASQSGIIERVRLMLRHRVEVSQGAKTQFPDDALRRPIEKVEVAAVQGFGRFGPFGPRHSDSTRRFDWKQDRGALIWLPWVAVGLAWAVWRGRVQKKDGDPPTAWAVALSALLTLAAVTAFLPLAWDRYLLDLQPMSALLAAGVAAAGLERLRGRPVPAESS